MGLNKFSNVPSQKGRPNSMRTRLLCIISSYCYLYKMAGGNKFGDKNKFEFMNSKLQLGGGLGWVASSWGPPVDKIMQPILLFNV